MKYTLGIDCGGTFIKAALFDQHGTLHSLHRENVAVISEQAGYAERDMHQLWQVCASVIRQVLQKSGISPNLIQAVGISAQGKGAFLLDRQRQPLGRAILSSDQRAIDIVKRWQTDNIPQQLYPLTRQTLWTGHPVAILRWLKENDPERYTNIGSLLMSHDYLRFCLTGELFCEETNISESNLYHMAQGNYDPALANLLGLQEMSEKLPPVIAPNTVTGFVTNKASEQCGLAVGTPVVGGLFDVVSTALCAELDDETKLNVVLGTWSVVSGVTEQIDQTQTLPFVYGKYVNPNQFIVHEASPTSAGNLEWFAKQWQLDYAKINQMVANIPPAQSSVLFMPFLYGTNATLGMQAGFYGLQAHHSQAHLLQAVYEGVLFSLMQHLNRMKIRFPNAKTLRVTGGPAKSAIWMQMLADLSGMPLEIPPIEETGCFGAAMVASLGVGNPIQPSQIAMQTVLPNPALFDAYQAKLTRYQKLVSLLGQMADEM